MRSDLTSEQSVFSMEKSKHIVQPVITFEFECSAMPKQEFLPLIAIRFGDVLPISDCVFVRSGFNDLIRLAEINALRDHYQ